jgi:hypothetical protein
MHTRTPPLRSRRAALVSAMAVFSGAVLAVAGSHVGAGPAFAAPPEDASADAARVSHLKGSATRVRGDARVALAVGLSVGVGDSVETGEKSRLELTLPDGSKLRLAPKSKATLDAASFEGKRRERVSLKLGAGRIWSNVVRGTGGGDTFEVRTDNAVTGVRGTSFSILASADASAIVRVYTGTVGVRPGARAPGERKPVAGPSQVSKARWEEIIAKAMEEVRISAAGEIAPASGFEDEGESLAWAEWNRARDGTRDAVH